jgi:hypothetical protein
MDPDPSIEYDEEAKVDYIDFADLQMTPDLSFESTLKLSSSEHWRDIFNSSDDLRRLNKFRTEEFTSRIHEFTEFICTQFNNLRSSISKNTAVLVEEIFISNTNFSSPYCESMQNFVTQIIPVIIAKVGYEKKFI